MRTTRTSPSTRAASTRAGTSCARSVSTSSSSRASSTRHWKLSRARPDPAAVDRSRAQGAGCCAAWRSMRRRSTAWTRASAASWRRSKNTGQLDNTRRHLPRRQRRLRRRHPRRRDGRRARQQADDRQVAHAHRRARALRQRSRRACRGRRTPTRATAPPGPISRTRRSASTSTGSTKAASRRR